MPCTQKRKNVRSGWERSQLLLVPWVACVLISCTGSSGGNDGGEVTDGDIRQDDGSHQDGDGRQDDGALPDGGDPADDGGPADGGDDGGNLTDCEEMPTEETFGAEPNPTCNPIGGGPGYSRIIAETDGSVTCVASTREELLDCLENAGPGDVVFVTASADIDMTGTPSVTIPDGVTLASDRGLGGSSGAKIKRTENLNGGWEEPMFVVGGDNVRVTGLRLEGEMYPQDYGNEEGETYESDYLVGIYAEERRGFEVDNCEMYGWAWSCVSLRQNAEDPIPYIHHNSIHHNQARGEGYGVNLYGGNALIEANLFDYNRHAITGAGHAGEKYEARYNIILGNGDAIGGHHFDVHQDEDGGDFAGDHFLIHHNTFRAGVGENGGILASVGIRHRPTTGCFIDHNLFEAISTETEDGKPIWQRNSSENLFATDNMWMEVLYPTNDGIVWYL